MANKYKHKTKRKYKRKTRKKRGGEFCESVGNDCYTCVNKTRRRFGRTRKCVFQRDLGICKSPETTRTLENGWTKKCNIDELPLAERHVDVLREESAGGTVTANQIEIGKSRLAVPSLGTTNVVVAHNVDNPRNCQCIDCLNENRRIDDLWRLHDTAERNGIIVDGPYENRPCWDLCKKKGWCEEGKWCDSNKYCHPANNNSLDQENGIEKQTCDPEGRFMWPSHLGGGKKNKRKSRKKKGGSRCGSIQNCRECVNTTKPNGKQCLWKENQTGQQCRSRNRFKRRTVSNGWLDSCNTASREFPTTQEELDALPWAYEETRKISDWERENLPVADVEVFQRSSNSSLNAVPKDNIETKMPLTEQSSSYGTISVGGKRKNTLRGRKKRRKPKKRKSRRRRA